MHSAPRYLRFAEHFQFAVRCGWALRAVLRSWRGAFLCCTRCDGQARQLCYPTALRLCIAGVTAVEWPGALRHGHWQSCLLPTTFAFVLRLCVWMAWQRLGLLCCDWALRSVTAVEWPGSSGVTQFHSASRSLQWAGAASAFRLAVRLAPRGTATMRRCTAADVVLYRGALVLPPDLDVRRPRLGTLHFTR